MAPIARRCSSRPSSLSKASPRPRTPKPKCGERVNVCWTHADGTTAYYAGTITGKIDWTRGVFRVKYDRRAGHKAEFSRHTFDDPLVRRSATLYPVGRGGSGIKTANNQTFVEAVSRLSRVAGTRLDIDAVTNSADDFAGLQQEARAIDLNPFHMDFCAFAAEAHRRALVYDAIYIDACGTFDADAIRAAVQVGHPEGFVLAFTFCTRDRRNTRFVGTYDRALAAIYRCAHEMHFDVALPVDGDSSALAGSKTYTDGGVTMSFGLVTLHPKVEVVPTDPGVGSRLRDARGRNGCIHRIEEGSYHIRWSEGRPSRMRCAAAVRRRADAYAEWTRGKSRALVIDAATAGTSHALRSFFA